MIAVISGVCGFTLAVGLSACGGGGATYVTVPMSQVPGAADAGPDDGADASAGPRLLAPASPAVTGRKPASGRDVDP